MKDTIFFLFVVFAAATAHPAEVIITWDKTNSLCPEDRVCRFIKAPNGEILDIGVFKINDAAVQPDGKPVEINLPSSVQVIERPDKE